MIDPHSRSNEPDIPTGTPALHHRGYTIQVQPTSLECMAVITRPGQRPAIVLAADREAVLVKAREWIGAQSPSLEGGSAGPG